MSSDDSRASQPGAPPAEQLAAGLIILTAWHRYKRRHIFILLKDLLSETEHTLSNDVLRQLVPGEVQLLQDPTVQAKVRFRLAGSDFPPDVVFKVFIPTSKHKGIQYFCGKDLIKPSSEAAEDALRQMGTRKFLDQMMEDALSESLTGMNSIHDAATAQDFMKYRSQVDEQSADGGGKANSWRKISLQTLYRPVGQQPLARSRARPSSVPSNSGNSAYSMPGADGRTRKVDAIKHLSRIGDHPKLVEQLHKKPRIPPSQLAKKKRLEKFRKLYGLFQKSPGEELIPHLGKEDRITDEEADGGGTGLEIPGEGDDEAEKLYVWSQQLRGDDIDLEF